MAQHEGQNDLKRTMKSRHLFMVSLGGVIGTGLFLSSGYTIGQAGSGGAMLAYLVGGFIMYLVMLCLGELSVAYATCGFISGLCDKVYWTWNRICCRVVILVNLGCYHCYVMQFIIGDDVKD
nr:amino acid ABC transporter permease [Priestia flexa]WEZ07428.1 amino acid ABC transporter permease [Priestia flexa]